MRSASLNALLSMTALGAVAWLTIVSLGDINTTQDLPKTTRSTDSIPDVITHRTYSQDTHLGAIPIGIQGTRGIGFVRPRDRQSPPSEMPQTLEFRLAPEEEFQPLLVLLNGTSEAKTFIVTALLDYQQVSFTVDLQYGLLHEVSVPSHSELQVPIRIPLTSPGAHDLVVVAFDDPYNLTLDADYRMDLFGRIAARRTVVISGGLEKPARTISTTDVGIAVPSSQQLRLPLAFAYSSPEASHPSSRLLFSGIASSAQPYRFQVWSSNISPDLPVNYAVVLFADYHQVPFAGQDVRTFRLEPGEEAVIDAVLDEFGTVGIRQLQMIRVHDPYRSLLLGEVYTPLVFGSPRIAISVK